MSNLTIQQSILPPIILPALQLGSLGITSLVEKKRWQSALLELNFQVAAPPTSAPLSSGGYTKGGILELRALNCWGFDASMHLISVAPRIATLWFASVNNSLQIFGARNGVVQESFTWAAWLLLPELMSVPYSNHFTLPAHSSRQFKS